MDIGSVWEDASLGPWRGRCATRSELSNSSRSPRWSIAVTGRSGRPGPPRSAPTHAVCAAAGVVVCGIKAEALVVLNEDWEAACFVGKCPGCFAAAARI